MRYSIRKQRQNKLNQQGVSLVELLVVMGILSIFLVILVGMLMSAITNHVQTEAYSAVTADGRYVIARLNYDIQRASAVTTPASLGGTGSTLALTISGNTYTYALSGSTLQLTDNVGTANLTGDRVTVSAVTFKRIGNVGGKDTVQCTFTLTSVPKPSNGTTSQSFTTTAELR